MFQWVRLGVNISNFPISLSAIGFHLGLGGEYSRHKQQPFIKSNYLIFF
jgi:hypothetical protein